MSIIRLVPACHVAEHLSRMCCGLASNGRLREEFLCFIPNNVLVVRWNSGTKKMCTGWGVSWAFSAVCA